MMYQRFPCTLAYLNVLHVPLLSFSGPEGNTSRILQASTISLFLSRYSFSGSVSSPQHHALYLGSRGGCTTRLIPFLLATPSTIASTPIQSPWCISVTALGLRRKPASQSD